MTPRKLNYTAVGTWRDECLAVQVKNGQKQFSKNGVNVISRNNGRKWWMDVVYVLINASWIRLALFVLGFSTAITLLFGLVFHFVCHDTDSFQDAFNLSYQTFSTIGYGILYPKNTCGNYMNALETFVGCLSKAALSGLVFAKFSQPYAPVIFASKCIIQRQGQRRILIIRAANASRSDRLDENVILEAKFQVIMMRKEYKSEDQLDLVLRKYVLTLEQENFLAFRKDIQLQHEIDESSPFVSLTEDSCKASDFLIHVEMIGTDSNTHAIIQATSEYTSQELLWNVSFQDMFYQEDDKMIMDFQLLHGTCPSVFINTSSRPLQLPKLMHQESSMVDFVAQTFHDLMELNPIEANTRLLLDDDELEIVSRHSIASSVAKAENAPRFDHIIPKHVPKQTSFYELYVASLKIPWKIILPFNFALFTLVIVLFALLYIAEFDGIAAYSDVQSKNSAFNLGILYSVQALTTVGFGTVGPSPSSTYQNALVCVQGSMGIIYLTIFTGVAWAKFARPTAHVEFSDHALLTKINGTRVLLVRAVNLREFGKLGGNSFRLGLSETNKRTGLRQIHELPLLSEVYPLNQVPVTLVHIIDEISPLAKFTCEEDLDQCNLHMVVVYSGVDNTFASSVFARKVYHSQDFVLDAHFVNCVELTSLGFVVDHDRFHKYERSSSDNLHFLG